MHAAFSTAFHAAIMLFWGSLGLLALVAVATAFRSLHLLDGR